MGVPEPAAAEPAPCPNCGAPVAVAYCPACGQGRDDHSRSLWVLLSELIEHHLFLNGRSMTTIATLVFRPGRLTRAYIEGKRIRFLSPIRVYLFSGIVFLVTIWVADIAIIQFAMQRVPRSDVESAAAEVEKEGTDIADAPVLSVPDPSDKSYLLMPTIEVLRPAGQGFEPPEAWKSGLQKASDKAAPIIRGAFYEMSHPRALNQVLQEWLPRLMIVLLPFAAAGLAILNWRRRLYFVDHLSFALHGQAFCFILLSLAVWLRTMAPNLPYLAWTVALVIVAYTFIAFRHVYGGGWLGAAVKIGLVGGAYLLLVAAGVLGVLIYGFATIAG
ncbi:MAG TPA: DUF3667 domain-containing protein [Stellaceae bacterium]|nr:DUF3667 domain-containing protein [Stellaceae bacterium]